MDEAPNEVHWLYFRSHFLDYSNDDGNNDSDDNDNGDIDNYDRNVDKTINAQIVLHLYLKGL